MISLSFTDRITNLIYYEMKGRLMLPIIVICGLIGVCLIAGVCMYRSAKATGGCSCGCHSKPGQQEHGHDHDHADHKDSCCGK